MKVFLHIDKIYPFFILVQKRKICCRLWKLSNIALPIFCTIAWNTIEQTIKMKWNMHLLKEEVTIEFISLFPLLQFKRCNIVTIDSSFVVIESENLESFWYFYAQWFYCSGRNACMHETMIFCSFIFCENSMNKTVSDYSMCSSFGWHFKCRKNFAFFG
jgi:hypothetical protein